MPEDAELTLDLPIVAGAPAADPRWGARSPPPWPPRPSPAALPATYQPAAAPCSIAVAGAPLAGPRRRATPISTPTTARLIDHAKPQAIDRGPRGA